MGPRSDFSNNSPFMKKNNPAELMKFLHVLSSLEVKTDIRSLSPI